MSPASQSFRFRESRRLLREAAVRLTAPGEGGELSGSTRDIATGGMFVSTPAPMPVGTSVQFVLQLGSEDEPADVEGEATVVWVRPEAGGADQPAGMGMRFSRVEPPGEERLALLFSERQGEGEVIPSTPPREAEEGEAEEAEVEEAQARDVEAEGETEAVEGDDQAEALDAIEPVEIVEAKPDPSKDDPPPIEPSVAAEDAAGAGEVEATHAELFGELAEDGDEDWMKPESKSRPWLWPAVGGAVLLLALIALRGPLMNLVGLGGSPAEESAPAEAPGFEISTPRAGADIPPDGAGESTEAAEPAMAERPAPAPPAVAVETRPAAEPAAAEPAAARRPPARPPAPAASTPSANATALRSITASAADDRTVIEIVGNAPFQRHHVMPLDAPPRLVVRLIGVGQGYDASAVSGPRLRGVRTGVHGRGATRNLHVVLDLAASDIAATVERRGDRIVVNLSD